MNQAVSAFVSDRNMTRVGGIRSTGHARPSLDPDQIVTKLDRLGDLLRDQGCQGEIKHLSARLDGVGDDMTAAGRLLDAVVHDVSTLTLRVQEQDAATHLLAGRVAVLEQQLAVSLAEGEQMATELESRLAALEARDHGPGVTDDALEAALGECSARLGQALALADGAGTGDSRVEDALWALSEQIASFESRLVGRLDPAPVPAQAPEPSADRIATPGWPAPCSTEEQIRLLLTGALNLPQAPDDDAEG